MNHQRVLLHELFLLDSYWSFERDLALVQLRVLLWFALTHAFQPPQFPIIGQFFNQNHIWTVAHHDKIDIESFPHHASLLKRPRKNSKMDFRFSLSWKWVRVRYHFKWLLKLYNLIYSDSRFVDWATKSRKSRNST